MTPVPRPSRTTLRCRPTPLGAVRRGPRRTGAVDPMGPSYHASSPFGGQPPGDRVPRHGGRPVADLTTRTEPVEPVILEPGIARPGRARGVPPLRREGPAKLTGAAKYADDLVFPGAWFGATIRSTDARATFVALEVDPDFDFSKVVVVTAADIPGDNIVSSIKADQPILVPIGGEIRHHAEPLALLAAPDKATLRAARRAVRVVTEPLPPVFDPEASDHVFAAYELIAGRSEEHTSELQSLSLHAALPISSARSRRTSRSSSRSVARSSTTPSRWRCSRHPTRRRCAPRAAPSAS